MDNLISATHDFMELFSADAPFIDVRAPVEFAQGHLPHAVNLPILTDEERAQVGTIYKESGSEAAMELGHKLVSGTTKDERVQQWLLELRRHPKAAIYCFRGGQRSQIAQRWMAEAGAKSPRLGGGYKKARQLLIHQIEQFSKAQDLLIVGGVTGSGKTLLLRDMGSKYPHIDFESLANHRGSAFGAMPDPQPSQANFENGLAVSMLKTLKSNVRRCRPLIEDESRMIGKITIPGIFFEKMRSSQVILIEESLNQRVDNIFDEYILNSPISESLHHPVNTDLAAEARQTFARFKTSVQAISRKLGGLRSDEILLDIANAENDFLTSKSMNSSKIWIEKLLHNYYDPLYRKSMECRKIDIAFRGSRAECAAWILENNH